jgi:hypothetical protein
MSKAKAAVPVLQAQIDAALAELKAKGAMSTTGKTVDEDKMQASESDEDMATMLAKNEATAEKEEKEAVKEEKAGPAVVKKDGSGTRRCDTRAQCASLATLGAT